MNRLVTTVAVAAAAGCFAGSVAAQPAANQVIGRATSQRMEIKTTTNTTVDTFTLSFGGPDDVATYTVDFVAQYAARGTRTAPSVVDMVLTEHPAADDHPTIELSVNGAPVAVVARLRQPRSIVTSMAFADFHRLAGADSIVQRAFNTNLVFGDAQRRMLQRTAERWSQ